MKKWLCAALGALTLFLGLPAMADGLEDMTDGERDAFRAEVRAYLLENPGVLLEAIEILEQQRQAAARQNDFDVIQQNYAAITDDGFSHVAGNPDGPITVVEFLDYRCGYCKKAHDEVAALVAGNSDIRYVIKEFPILGEDSVNAARAAVAVLLGQPGDVYYDFHNRLMKHNGPINEMTLSALLKEAGGDPALMLADIQDERVTEIIDRNHELGLTLQISGTPTFVIGTEMIRGYVPFEAMQGLVDGVRAALLQ